MLKECGYRGNNRVVPFLYFFFVCSALEYNFIIWDPHEARYNTMVERLQRNFAQLLHKNLYEFYPYLYPSMFALTVVGQNISAWRCKCTVMVYYLLNWWHKIITYGLSCTGTKPVHPSTLLPSPHCTSHAGANVYGTLRSHYSVSLLNSIIANS